MSFVNRREGRGTVLIWGQGNLFLCGLNITLKHLNSTGSKGPFVTSEYSKQFMGSEVSTSRK